MKCRHFGQLLVLLTLSTSAFAGSVRPELKRLTDELNYENCEDTTSSIAYLMNGMTASGLQEELKSDRHENILSDLWSTKISLHERLRSFHRVGSLSQDCADGMRNAFIGIRTLEDDVEENYLRTSQGSVTFSDNAFEPGNPHVRRHPEFLGFDMMKDLKSGDIILSRGKAYTSAAISQLGNFDTQFSHLSVVYKDPQGKFWTVEAHIEVGSFVRPLEEHIEDKNFRTAVYRFDDSAVAAKAAEFIFNRVKKASDTTGNILYDFGFNLDENKQLFCSEIASFAYDKASEGAIKLPLFRSRVLERKPKFVNQLGIKVEDSFIPADMEVDPRFKLISEFRNANIINDIQEKDAVLHAMFKWSDEEGYLLRQGSSGKSFLYRNIAWPLRRVPYLKKYFVEKMPINMSRKLIGYFGVLESTGKFLQDKLKVENEASRNERGISLTKAEKYSVLQNVREADKAKVRPKLHHMFKP